MTLLEQVKKDILVAMKAKDADALRGLRGLKGALETKETEKRGQERDVEATLTSDEEIAVLQKALKTRRESADIYSEQNRPDLVSIENQEIDVLEKYLPKQLTPDEVLEIVKNTVAEVGATSQKDMGKVMNAAKVIIAGRSDNKTISETVKSVLTFA